MTTRALLSLSMAAALSVPALAQASTWQIDPSHSEVGFSVRHLMISNVKGKFTDFSGTVDLNEADIRKSKVAVTIRADSIETEDDKRDKHLRSPDFLNAEAHPSLEFTSTRVKRRKGGLDVHGKLTIRGVTKPVVLKVEGPSKAVKDPWGTVRRGASAHLTINRKDFGLTWNKALETGGVLVGDEVKISLEVELTEKAGKSS